MFSSKGNLSRLVCENFKVHPSVCYLASKSRSGLLKSYCGLFSKWCLDYLIRKYDVHIFLELGQSRILFMCHRRYESLRMVLSVDATQIDIFGIGIHEGVLHSWSPVEMSRKLNALEANLYELYIVWVSLGHLTF